MQNIRFSLSGFERLKGELHNLKRQVAELEQRPVTCLPQEPAEPALRPRPPPLAHASLWWPLDPEALESGQLTGRGDRRASSQPRSLWSRGRKVSAQRGQFAGAKGPGQSRTPHQLRREGLEGYGHLRRRIQGFQAQEAPKQAVIPLNHTGEDVHQLPKREAALHIQCPSITSQSIEQNCLERPRHWTAFAHTCVRNI